MTEAATDYFIPLRPIDSEWSWQLEARCRTADPELFFHPEQERGTARHTRQRKAKQICADSAVRRECGTAAIRTREGFGIWGGMFEEERIRFLYAAGTIPVGGARNPDRKKHPVVVG